MISSQRPWPLDHEAGPITIVNVLKYYDILILLIRCFVDSVCELLARVHRSFLYWSYRSRDCENICVFWGVTSYSLVDMWWCFRRSYRLHHQGRRMRWLIYICMVRETWSGARAVANVGATLLRKLYECGNMWSRFGQDGQPFVSISDRHAKRRAFFHFQHTFSGNLKL